MKRESGYYWVEIEVFDGADWEIVEDVGYWDGYEWNFARYNTAKPPPKIDEQHIPWRKS